MAKIKSDRWTPVDMCTHPECMMIIRQTLHDISSLRVHDKILALRLRSNGHDLNIMIRIQIFHYSR